MTYQMHCLAQNEDNILVCNHAWSGQEEVRRGEVEERNRTNDHEG